MAKPVTIYRVTDYTTNEHRYYGTLEWARIGYRDLQNGQLAKLTIATELPRNELILACLNRDGFSAYVEMVTERRFGQEEKSNGS